MSPNAAFTVYYSAVLLRDGGIKTAIEAERTAHDALLSVREDLAPGSWEAIGIYTAIPTIAAFDGDSRQAPKLTNAIKSSYFPASDTTTDSVVEGTPLPGKVWKPACVILPFPKRTAEGADRATA
jgi:hypothetical protein